MSKQCKQATHLKKKKQKVLSFTKDQKHKNESNEILLCNRLERKNE